MSYPCFADLSRSFAPGWFAAVMGTGVLALTTHGLAPRWPWLAPLAEGLHWFNSLLFVLLALPWLNRWLRFRPAAMQTLMHPVQANFYPTFSIALLVLAAQWLTFTPCVEVAMALWWLGVIAHFLLSFAVLLLVTGRLGDRFGPRPVFVWGLVVFTLSSLACGLSGLAGDIELLVAARAVQGVGAALMTPQTMSMITRNPIPCAVSTNCLKSSGVPNRELTAKKFDTW